MDKCTDDWRLILILFLTFYLTHKLFAELKYWNYFIELTCPHSLRYKFHVLTFFGFFVKESNIFFCNVKTLE